MDAESVVEGSANPLSDEEFLSAFELLRTVTPARELEDMAPLGGAAVYTTLVTLWMLTLQRLKGGASLVDVVKTVRDCGEGVLPVNKRVREKTLSSSSGAYCKARQRLPENVCEFFAHSVCRSLIDQTPHYVPGRRMFTIDGTTVPLPPTDALSEAFPPATNQHTRGSVWPILLLVAAHELQSGSALVPEIGAMYGDDNTSEARLAVKLLARLPESSIVLADSGFGIFFVCHAVIQAGHDLLIRLTKVRHKALLRNAELVHKTTTSTTHRLRWVASRYDRNAHPELSANAGLDVFLHEIQLENGQTLPLVTTLDWTAEEAANAYALRYSIETDLSDLKVTMKLERIRARTPEMVRKELLCSVVAYNLVQQFRQEAAKIAKVPPRRLSFKGVWTTFEIMLLHKTPCSGKDWLARYEQALKMAAKDKLANRPGRKYPRQAHYRRPKWGRPPRTTPKAPPKDQPQLK